MKKPIIGVVARPKKDFQGRSILKIDEDIRRSIIKAGGIPYFIMPMQDVDYENTPPKLVDKLNPKEKSDLIKILNKLDGIILPGGTKWYDYDRVICEYAINNDIPTLGICMGMQLIASYVNNLNNNEEPVKLAKSKAEKHYVLDVDDVHKVKIFKNTKLYNIVKKDEIIVNSRHHYIVNKISDCITVSAMSIDNTIEAIELSNKKFIIGIQWHPENITYKKENLQLFEFLVDVSKIKGGKILC